MDRRSRRGFLEDVGRGMLVASLGSATALELGLSPSIADEPGERLTFGHLEEYVAMMQETPPDELLPRLVGLINAGTNLKTLVTSAALANSRAFGGQDYTGYHTFMALVPAYQMAGELPPERRALPVLKVLYRNTSRIHEQGANEHDVMQRVAAAESANTNGEQLREAVRAVDWQGADSQFAATAQGTPGEAFNHLQFAVQDEVNVHRVVLAWRAWAMIDLTGQQYAHTMLRQSLLYCLDQEENIRDRGRTPSAVRDVLPRLLDEHRLLSKSLGDRPAEDGWMEELARSIVRGTREKAAEAAANALAEGIDPEAVGEAISMAANLLVLHDPGRREQHSSAAKPPGCVHGDSVGVHATDAANAWRNIARVSNHRNQIASLIVGAYHTAGQSDWITDDPYPYAEQMDELATTDAGALLGQAEEAIRGNDQARACAIVDRYGQLEHSSRPLFDVLLKFAVSEDGALHAEKYYRTVGEEYVSTRAAFRWRQMIALARVTASEYGYPAPGYAEACELLNVT